MHWKYRDHFQSGVVASQKHGDSVVTAGINVKNDFLGHEFS
jgi:hypothetical protein